LTVIVTAAVSAPLPAIGTHHEYGIMPDPARFKPSSYLIRLHEPPLVRDGSLRVLDSSMLGGIINFPSFHAAAAVLAPWERWSAGWMRPLARMANVGMLPTTPLVGGIISSASSPAWACRRW
jgi:hypothetical protein